MKTLFTGLVILIYSINLQAATTYTISANDSWSGGGYPSYCNTCTFNISSGIAFTLNSNATCFNCTINGGILQITQDFTFQQSAFNNTTINFSVSKTLSLQNNGTSFTNTILNASGSSTIYPTGTTTITGSTFNFSGSAYFNYGSNNLLLSGSKLYFYGNAHFLAGSGNVTLNNGSQMVAGDGSVGSAAYLYFNGATLRIMDVNSGVYAAAKNNYYFNWSAYYSGPTNSNITTAGMGTANCGHAGQNSCSSPNFYGCASFTSSGYSVCLTLATTVDNFKVSNSGNGIKLNWNIYDLEQNTWIRIERSTDGSEFSPLTTIQSGSESGAFSYTDTDPLPGRSFYRICLISRDGKVSYSKIVSTEQISTQEATIYPNPVTNGLIYLKMPSAESISVSVYNTGGQLLFMSSYSGQIQYAIRIPQASFRQLLIVRVVTHNKSTSFNLISLP